MTSALGFLARLCAPTTALSRARGAWRRSCADVAQVLRRCGAGPSCSSPKGRAAKRPCHAPRLRRVCALGPLPCRFRCKSRPRRSAAAGCARGRRRRSGCRLRWARTPLLPAGRRSLYAAVGFGHRHACCAAATAKVGRWLRLAVRRNGTGSAPYCARVGRRVRVVRKSLPHAGRSHDTMPGRIPCRGIPRAFCGLGCQLSALRDLESDGCAVLPTR